MPFPPSVSISSSDCLLIPHLNIFTLTQAILATNSKMEALLNNIQSFTSESTLLAKCGMLALAIFAALNIYTLSLVIYRLYFDPLAGFPGPRIAAATGWYEFYHDVIRRGQYIYKIEEMHKKYGIVKHFLHLFRCSKIRLAIITIPPYIVQSS